MLAPSGSDAEWPGIPTNQLTKEHDDFLPSASVLAAALLVLSSFFPLEVEWIDGSSGLMHETLLSALIISGVLGPCTV
jgi:hypothetical protein